MKLFYLILISFCFGCSSLTHTSITTKQLPELGTIGVFENYVSGSYQNPKTIVSINEPVRVKVETIKVTERKLFGKDSIPQRQQDSILLSFEILDKLSLLQQINAEEQTLKYLKLAANTSTITKTVMYFNSSLRNEILASDEIYLVQNKQKTLSLQLRSNNKISNTIEFVEGTITSVEASSFCWGENRRRKIEIFDIIPKGSKCNEGLYTSARKAKKAYQVTF